MGSYAVDLLCLAIPLLNFVPVSLIGVLPGGELLTLAAVLPCLVVALKRIWRGYNKAILILMGLWFLSQLVTDFYRHSPFPLMARGLAAIAFFAIDVMVISAFAYRKPRRIILLIVGQIIGSALYFYLFSRSALQADEGTGVWKFGYSSFVIPAVILVSCYFYGKRQYWVTFILLIGLAGYNLSQNFRSQMLIIMASSMLVVPLSAFRRNRKTPPLRVLPDLQSRPHTRSQRVPIGTVVLLVLVVSAGVGITNTYSYLAAQGSLGDRAQEKYLEQSRGKFGLLLGGRPESLISWRAVVDSPILGHGSWAEDRKFTEMFADIEEEAGYTDDENHDDKSAGSYQIPAHSYLMQAWVWAGLLGAVFWFYVLYLTGKSVLRVALEQPALSPYLAYFLLSEFWNVLFSPFGYTVRMDQAIALVIICSLIDPRPQQGPVRDVRLRSKPLWIARTRRVG